MRCLSLTPAVLRGLIQLPKDQNLKKDMHIQHTLFRVENYLYGVNGISNFLLNMLRWMW